MKKITINASKKYDIIIDDDLISRLSTLLPEKKALIVTDANVFSIYKEKICKELDKLKIIYSFFVIDAGEESKNPKNLIAILNSAANFGLTRSDMFVAFGGGVCGDLCGFAASVFLRGIDFIQIPTTLLSAVDSSVGGKTAINLEAGKNLAGSFYQPTLVICDISLFKTLKPEIFSDGMAEVIKYAFLNTNNILQLISKIDLDFENIVFECISIKKKFVEEDEFDKGNRQLLNFGHTLGHAIEKLSNYQISHGRAISIGMTIVTKAAVNANICSNEILSSLIDILRKYNLPTNCAYSSEELLKITLSDKKRFSDTINLIVPNNTECVIHNLKISELLDFIESGL